jgi:hypothetical protein
MTRRLIALLFAAILMAPAVGGAACPPDPLPQASSGYGADGRYAVDEQSFSNPEDPTQRVYVYAPVDGTPAPTVFFSHAFGARDPALYGATIRHLVSRGYAVVYPQYPTRNTAEAADSRYDVLWTGFTEAVKRYPLLLDTSRVGFFGHSFGAGATPRMMLNGIAAGWGTAGKAMFVMAPWYSLRLSDADLAGFDPGVKLSMMVYDDDRVNDHEMAIEVYHHIAIPDSGKAFFKIDSDSEQDCSLVADHTLPTEAVNGGLDGLDYWNWYHMDALLDYSFTGSEAARQIALGGGSAEQVFWGKWYTGRDYKPAEVSQDPLPSKPSDEYEFPCDSSANPRRAACGTRRQTEGDEASGGGAVSAGLLVLLGALAWQRRRLKKPMR